MVANLIHIRSITNRTTSINHSVFFHPGVLIKISDDVSRRFDLSLSAFLTLSPANITKIIVFLFLDTVPSSLRGDFISDLSAVQIAIGRGGEGHLYKPRTSAIYAQWTSHYTDLQVDHQPQTTYLPNIKLLQVF